MNFDARVAGRARVEERLNDAQIGVVQADVFADERDAHMTVHAVDLVDQRAPLGHVRFTAVKVQLAAHHAAKALVLKQQRHLVERGRRCVLDDAVGLHVAEERNLAADVVCDGLIRAHDENVRLDALAQELLDRVLRGLALELAAAGNGHDERHVDEEHIFAPALGRDLTDGLQKRLALDIADRAADLGDGNVGLAVVHVVNAALDLIGHMRDDLHRAAKITALTLAVENAPEDFARGHGGLLVQRLVDKALVVAEVQVGLRAVVRDEDLAVLIRAHRAGVDVEIRVKLLVLDLQSALLEQTPERRRADALAQPRHHAAGDKNVLHKFSSSPVKGKSNYSDKAKLHFKKDARESVLLTFTRRRVIRRTSDTANTWTRSALPACRRSYAHRSCAFRPRRGSSAGAFRARRRRRRSQALS